MRLLVISMSVYISSCYNGLKYRLQSSQQPCLVFYQFIDLCVLCVLLKTLVFEKFAAFFKDAAEM